MRYKDKLTLRELGDRFGTSNQMIYYQMNKVLIQMRRHRPYSCYIRYGIEGFIKHQIEMSTKAAYEQGYIATIGDLENNAAALSQDIINLDLSVRAFNCLKRRGVCTVQDILKFDKDDLLRTRNMGIKSYNEIISKMEEIGVNCDHLK